MNLFKLMAENRCDPLVLPRQRQLPRLLDDGISEDHFDAVKDMYRKEYYEVIDNVKGEPEKHARQQNFLFIQSIKNLLLDSANGKPVTLSEKVQDVYRRVAAETVASP